jgi:diphosphomevalonate decarboxylase
VNCTISSAARAGAVWGGILIIMPTAIAPANIAFVKYWGMRDTTCTLPYNGSISLNLDSCLTTTTVTLDETLTSDEVTLTLYQQEPQPARGSPRDRVVAHLDRLRALAGVTTCARVDSHNNFPSDAGIASSAAAFAALTVAACAAFAIDADTALLSRLARLSGSGSACRSIPTGYVEWYNGDDATSYAASIAPPEHWALADVVAVVDPHVKKIGSAANHRLATTSPYFQTRLDELANGRLDHVREAILHRDLTRLGELIEADAISMHVICMTQVPPSFYWNGGTFDVLHAVREWRAQGLEAYVTMDAGANVHVICAATDRNTVQARLEQIPSVQFTLANGPGPGARLVAPA